MLRTALRPRYLGLLVVALVLVVLGIIAGRWQWSVAHDVARADAVREVQEQPVRPLAEVMAPHESFPDDGSGQRVTATGRYVGAPLVVVDRRYKGQHVEWVLDRFVVDGTGANLAVVRGFVPEGEDPPSPPTAPAVWAGYRAGAAWWSRVAAGESPRAAWLAGPSRPPETDWPMALAEAARGALASGRGSVIVVPDQRDVSRVDAALTEVLGPDRHVRLTADQGPQARYTAWLKVLRGHVRVVVGTRAAAYAPVQDLGLVAWWDDGDDLHEEPRAPYAHVREVLMTRADVEDCALLVGGLAMSTDVAALVDAGQREVVLSGVDLTSYRDRGRGIAALAEALLAQVRAAAPGARLVVTGYPRLFNEVSDCSPFTFVTVAEMRRLTTVADALAEAVLAAADDGGADGVDVRAPFAGRCTRTQHRNSTPENSRGGHWPPLQNITAARVSAHAAAAEQVHDRQQDDRADQRDDEAHDAQLAAVDRRRAQHRADQQTADESADDADDDVEDDPLLAIGAHDQAGEPTHDAADDQPDDDSHGVCSSVVRAVAPRVRSLRWTAVTAM